MLKLFRDWKVLHIFREGNGSAHWLAQFAKSTKCCHVWSDNWHPEFHAILSSKEQTIVVMAMFLG